MGLPKMNCRWTSTGQLRLFESLLSTESAEKLIQADADKGNVPATNIGWGSTEEQF